VTVSGEQYWPLPSLNSPFEVGAPEVVGGGAGGQRRALGSAARAALMGDEPVAVEHAVDGADSGNLAGAPVRLMRIHAIASLAAGACSR
jgi:hypothetical protein